VATNPMTIDQVLAYLGDHGFTSNGGKRVHHHRVTGARVVVANAEPVDLVVHAHGGKWRAQLTRVPFAVFTATVAAASF
jgi:hypothetical protein